MDTIILWSVMILLAMLGSNVRQERGLMQSSRALANRFHRIGSLSGLSKEEIVKKVGLPQSIKAIPTGQLVQWNTEGFHVAIRFDQEGKFEGMTYSSAT
jgi:hypothetical protein